MPRLSPYARNECLAIAAIALMATIAALLLYLAWLIPPILLAALALLSFFRDPHRQPPAQRNIVVAPADGVISSIHDVEHYEPFDGPAICVRIFLSVFNVHINRAPCHGKVRSVVPRPGRYRNALNPESAEDNNAVTVILDHPVKRHPVAAVRQVSGMLARTIACHAQPEQILQRGQRFGMIKLGSTTELYLPLTYAPRVVVESGQKVQAGLTVLAEVASPQADEPPIPNAPAQTQPEPETTDEDVPESLFEESSPSAKD